MASRFKSESVEITEAVAAQDKRVRLISHGENRGMGAGMRTGFSAATGDYFTLLAADGQVPANQIEKLLPHLSKATLVSSVYSKRPSERYRVMISFGLRALMRVLIGTQFQLEGIYLFPVKLAQDELDLDNIKSNTFFFSFELITRAIQKGATVFVTEVEPRARMAGESKVANSGRIKRVGNELIAFRHRLQAEGSLGRIGLRGLRR